MRWTRAALETRAPACGRRSRVVLTPRRRRQVCEKTRRRRRQESPISGESTKETVKTTRVRECRVFPGATVVTTLVCYLHTAHEAAGATGTRHSPRPRFRAQVSRTARAPRAAGREGVFRTPRHCEERKRRSNPFFRTVAMDCFACARNDGLKTLASWLFEKLDLRTREARYLSPCGRGRIASAMRSIVRCDPGEGLRPIDRP